ncbi:R-spondin-2 [Lates japonicus]|uniref:R-spondin-2 n=1 Tax=Lates japonicus TaxID=270547 RepID=A0AAD3M7S9_LATJO|nr:R-spondin-2 [Lates japonicus]
MQFRLFSFALIVLNCMEYSNCQAPSHRWRRNKRASYGAYPICKGCSVCSRDNGCVNCQPKLFLFLRRERMRQYGECLHDCPAGYYGMRSPELNMCSSKSSRVSPTQLPLPFTSTPQSPTSLTFTSFSQHTHHRIFPRHTYTLCRLLLSHNT